MAAITMRKKTTVYKKVTVGKTNIVNSNERTVGHPHRFVSAFDLWTRFNDIKEKYNEKIKNREAIIRAYERQAYRQGRDPNWGQFRGMIGKAIKQVVNTLLNRKVWARIETREGDDNSIQWSDDITEAFHKYCIKPWHKKDQLSIAIAKDAVLWNKAFLHWCSPFECYPEYLGIDDVYFDMNTKLDLDTCEICFIRKRMSLIQLYDKIEGDDGYTEGWNKTAVMQCLTDFADTLKSDSEDSVTEVFKRGGLTQADRDKRISLLFCYIKEYEPAEEDHERAGNQYTLYVIPESPQGFGILKDGRTNEDEVRERDYLLFNDYNCKSLTQVIGVQSMHYMDSIHSEDSFARQIFTTCKFYDNAMNRMIRAALRALKLYIKTSNPKTKAQLKASTDSEVEFLGDSDTVEQVQIRQNIGDVAQIARRAVIDMNEQFGTEFKGSANSEKGYPLTKGEAEIEANKLNDANSTDVKIMVSQNRATVEEIYRRFLLSQDHCAAYRGLEQFKKEMKKKKIPSSAYAYENVCVYSRYNQFAGSASASVSAAEALLQATQIVVSSPAEARAKRELLSALSGEANVSDFDTQVAQFDNELFIIGQENVDLDDPDILPVNIPVSSSDSHLLHIRGHLIDMQEKLRNANQKLVEYANTQSYRRLFILNSVANIVNAQDNKGAHIQAHIQLLSKDETHKDDLAQIMPVLRQTNQQQDLLANQILQAQQREETNQKIVSADDQAFQHQQRMNELQAQAFEAQKNYDLGKVASQTQARQQVTEQNQQIKVQHKQQDQELKTQGTAIDLAAKEEAAKLDIGKKAALNRLDIQKAANKPTATK